MVIASKVFDFSHNCLLNALSPDEKERIFPYLELVELSFGEILFGGWENLDYAYFPINSIVSLLYSTESGAFAEIAMVGFEGVVSVSLFMTGQSMPNRAVVQTAGYAFRIEQKYFMEEFNCHEGLLSIMLKYTQVLITQMAQTAVCNRYHSIEQQLCRWLLQSLDRFRDNKLLMTYELIANLLGVNREKVVIAAKNLQQAGLIKYHRGNITVVDRIGLEERVCECYEVVQQEAERLLGAVKPPARRIRLVRHPDMPENSCK